MKQSNLIKLNYKIALKDLDIVKQNNNLLDALNNLTNIYSYIVFNEYKNKELQGWSIIINVHEMDEYNTVPVKDAVYNILNSIQVHLNKIENGRVAIGFGQPSLELMLQIYQPFVNSLARKTQMCWKSYEYEDLVSVCNLCICILYNAGYYLNKQLVQRSFNNYVLMELRKNKNAPTFVSLDAVNENGMSYKDILADTLIDEQQEEEEYKAMRAAVLEEECKLLQEYIGNRMYNELLRQYRSKVTDQTTTSQIRRIRQQLRRNGITYESIIKIIDGE